MEEVKKEIEQIEEVKKPYTKETQRCVDLFLEGKTLDEINTITGYGLRSIAMRLRRSGHRQVVKNYDRKREKTKEELAEELNQAMGLELHDLDRLSIGTLTLLLTKFNS
jgi:hypothetical protein